MVMRGLGRSALPPGHTEDRYTELSWSVSVSAVQFKTLARPAAPYLPRSNNKPTSVNSSNNSPTWEHMLHLNSFLARLFIHLSEIELF